MFTKVYRCSPKRAKTLTILPEESLIHWDNSKFVFSDTRVATPPCLPSADDQKLFPRHLACRESIAGGRAASVFVERQNQNSTVSRSQKHSSIWYRHQILEYSKKQI